MELPCKRKTEKQSDNEPQYHAEDKFTDNFLQNEQNASLPLTCPKNDLTANSSIKESFFETDLQSVLADFDKIHDTYFCGSNYDIFSRSASPVNMVVTLGKAKSNKLSCTSGGNKDGNTSDREISPGAVTETASDEALTIQKIKPIQKTVGAAKDKAAPERKVDPKIKKTVDHGCSKTPKLNNRINRCGKILPAIVEEKNLPSDSKIDINYEISQPSQHAKSWSDETDNNIENLGTENTQEGPSKIIHPNKDASYVISSDNFHPLFVTSKREVQKLFNKHVEVMTILQPTRLQKIGERFKRFYNNHSVDYQQPDEDRPPHHVQEDLYKYRLTFAMVMRSSGEQNATPNILDVLVEHQNNETALPLIAKICRLCGERCRRFVVKNHNVVIKMAAVYMTLVLQEDNKVLIGLCQGCDTNLSKIACFMFTFLSHNQMITERYQCFLCLRTGNTLLVHADKKIMAKLAQAFYGIYCKLPPLYVGPRLICKWCQSTMLLYQKMQNLLKNTNLVFSNPDERFYTKRLAPHPPILKFRFPARFDHSDNRLKTFKLCTANVDALFGVSLSNFRKLRKCLAKMKRPLKKIQMEETQANPISTIATSSSTLTEAEYEEEMSTLDPKMLGLRPPKHTVKRKTHSVKFRPVYDYLSSDED